MKLTSSNDSRAQKLFIANITFDQYRAQHRAPLFLNRNIMQVLEYHDRRYQKLQQQQRQQQQQQQQKNGNTENGSTSVERSVPTPGSQSRTSRSLRDRFKPVYHERDAELIVDMVDLRKKLNFKETANQVPEESPVKKAKTDEVRCYAYLAIWDNRPNFQDQEPVFKQLQTCSLFSYQANGGIAAARIEMDKPFRIKARDIFVPVKKNGTEIMAVGEKYSMEIKILPSTSVGEWPPIPVLHKSEGSLNPDGTKRVFGSTEGYLVAKYLNLPFAPTSDVPLSVSFDQGGRTHKTKYGFEVSADWRANPSPLEQYMKDEEMALEEPDVSFYDNPFDSGNDASQRKQRVAQKMKNGARRQAQLSDTVHVKPKTTIYYYFEPVLPKIQGMFKGFETCRVEGYLCPNCRLEYQTLRQLHFHLTTHHTKFGFTIDKEEQEEGSSLPPKVIIKVEEAEIVRERASDHVKDPREMDWRAPKRPLNVDEYLNGDSSWVGGTFKKRKAPKSIVEKDKPKTSSAWALPSFRNPSEVPDLPQRVRQKFPIPPAKTSRPTAFYRSISHQIIDPEDKLSESDDEIDMTWLKQKHHAKLVEKSAQFFDNEIQQRIRVAFDEHLIDERLPNTRYVSDAFVRFLRKMKNECWLWQQGKLEVIKLCAEMMEDGVMNNSVFLGIMEMFNDWELPTSEHISQSVEVDMIDVRPEYEQNGHQGTQHFQADSDLTHLSPDPDMYGCCASCLRYITRRRQTVNCHKPDCPHPWRRYHVSCAHISTSTEGFVCESCKTEESQRKAKQNLMISDHLHDISLIDSLSVSTGPNISTPTSTSTDPKHLRRGTSEVSREIIDLTDSSPPPSITQPPSNDGNSVVFKFQNAHRIVLDETADERNLTHDGGDDDRPGWEGRVFSLKELRPSNGPRRRTDSRESSRASLRRSRGITT